MQQHEMARRCSKGVSCKSTSVSLGINVGRLHPSHGSGRISWWNSSDPPEKNRTTRNAGKVPVSKRAARHNGTYSKYFVLLPPSLSPAVTSPYDRLCSSLKLSSSQTSQAFQRPPHRRKKSQIHQSEMTLNGIFCNLNGI